MASDLLRTFLSVLLIGVVLTGQSYATYLVLSFLGDFVFIFFKRRRQGRQGQRPGERGTKTLSSVDAANHVSNIGG